MEKLKIKLILKIIQILKVLKKLILFQNYFQKKKLSTIQKQITEIILIEKNQKQFFNQINQVHLYQIITMN